MESSSSRGQTNLESLKKKKEKDKIEMFRGHRHGDGGGERVWGERCEEGYTYLCTCTCMYVRRYVYMWIHNKVYMYIYLRLWELAGRQMLSTAVSRRQQENSSYTYSHQHRQHRQHRNKNWKIGKTKTEG